MSDVTRILSQFEQGDPVAAEKLLPLVYDELRKLAAARLAHEKPGQTLQATALVHEAYLRLVAKPGVRSQDSEVGEDPANPKLTADPGPRSPSFDGRGHFFAAAAEAMRRILIDQARHKRSGRGGGGRQRCELSDDDRVTLPISDELLDLDEALTRLSAVDSQAAELVKLRVFAGLTFEEAAAVQGVSTRTAKRDWAYARAWLGRALADS
jgi:RNA polymerase sigma factor (TIGR02999 family)